MSEIPDFPDWLEQLGLSKYAAAFAEHEIDGSVLAELSDDDLKEIGLPLGPRRKIQKALATLNQVEADQAPGHIAERRHLTVMFADLVGSSELSTKMDPEELRMWMREFQNASKAAVEKFQGFVARYMGDGILAYFGYPQAHEDDAERSVRAGLELIRQTEKLNDRAHLVDAVNFQVRVGIATGAVVVGDLIGEGSSAERAVVGETPNIAARIEAAAPSDSVVVGESTYNLLGSQFETTELESIVPKGFKNTVRLFRIIKEKRFESRFKATRAGSDVPFVGRETELKNMTDNWQAACAANGNALLISGEAGVGKSRFLHEFLQRIAPDNPNIIQFQCSPFHANTALHPIADYFANLAQLQDTDTPETRHARLEAVLADTGRPVEESVQLLAALLAVDTGTELPELYAGNPALLLQEIHKLIIEQLLQQSLSKPTLLVFEDAHWMDPTTVENVLQLARDCANHSVFIVVTTRPQTPIDDSIGKKLPTLSLTGLSNEEAAELVRSVRDGGSLSKSACDAVLDRTDGIPLFIEELTKLVLERGDDDDSLESNIPTTLVDSLTARLDRLGSCKEMAQIGATIGREFSWDLLRRIDKRVAGVVKADLARLIEAELIKQVGPEDDPVYRFKHALVQDAAYGTLLHAKRREHHALIADTLVSAFPNTARDKPELLALHLYEGGRPLEAVDYWQQAGNNATQQSAHIEAVNHLSRAINTLHEIQSPSPADLNKEFQLQISLGAPLIAARGYASEELESAFSRAREIDQQLHQGVDNFRALWGLGSFYLIRGQLRQSLDIQYQCAALAEKTADPVELLQSASWLGTVLFYNNRFAEAEQRLEQALALYQPESAASYGFQYGLDPAVLARVHLTWMYWLQGKTELSFAFDEETLVLAESLNHPLSHAHAQNFSVVLHTFQNNYDEAMRRADRLLSFASEREFPHYVAYSKFMRGQALARNGAVEEGIREMNAGLLLRRETGAELARPMYLTLLADILAEVEQYTESLLMLDEADAIVANNGEHWYEAETRRVRGSVLYRQSPAQPDAVKCLQQAIDMAAETGQKNSELRAAKTLAELQAKT